MKTKSTVSRKDNAQFAFAALAILLGLAILRGLTAIQERFGKGG